MLCRRCGCRMVVVRGVGTRALEVLECPHCGDREVARTEWGMYELRTAIESGRMRRLDDYVEESDFWSGRK